jgi:hypothetical protein
VALALLPKHGSTASLTRRGQARRARSATRRLSE